MPPSVCVQVHNLDLDEDSTFAILDEFDDVSFAQVDGLALATVHVDAGQPVVETVLAAMERLARRLGAEPTRVDPELVTVSEIGYRVGVSREAARKWTQSVKVPFPVHFACTDGGQKLWRWVEVAAWLREAKRIEIDHDLPTLPEIARIDACLSRALLAPARGWTSTSQEVFVETVETRAQFKIHVQMHSPPVTPLGSELVRNAG